MFGSFFVGAQVFWASEVRGNFGNPVAGCSSEWRRRSHSRVAGDGQKVRSEGRDAPNIATTLQATNMEVDPCRTTTFLLKGGFVHVDVSWWEACLLNHEQKMIKHRMLECFPCQCCVAIKHHQTKQKKRGLVCFCLLVSYLFFLLGGECKRLKLDEFHCCQLGSHVPLPLDLRRCVFPFVFPLKPTKRGEGGKGGTVRGYPQKRHAHPFVRRETNWNTFCKQGSAVKSGPFKSTLQGGLVLPGPTW